MTQIHKDILKAIHEGKWLSIEYKNKEQTITKYWIGIKEIHLQKRMLVVDGLRLGKLALGELTIHINSILSAVVLDGTYYELSRELKDDIAQNPEKYRSLFGAVANLKILNYLDECHKLDTTPYQCEYELIRYLDRDTITDTDASYPLSNEQFSAIIHHFGKKQNKKSGRVKIQQLCMNIMSIHTPRGLYVLAYRRLDLDVKNQSLRPAPELTICREFTINGEKLRLAQFLDADETGLIDDFEANQEIIKDRITLNNPHINGADDMPWIVAIGFDILVDLRREYKGILDMFDAGKVTMPIQAFFGELLRRPVRRKEYPIALLNKRVNLDQLLAINNAMKYPLTYVQGPPGTGKTNTILNTIITAFFNERTVLFASYNNHPIDSVFESFRAMKYRGISIPFPVIRLGSNEKVAEALKDIKKLYEAARSITTYEKMLNKNKTDKIRRSQKLTSLLKKHEQIREMEERQESIETLMRSGQNLSFQTELQNQLNEVKRQLSEMGTVQNDEALALIVDDIAEFQKYLYYTSVGYIKRLDEPKYRDLLDIIEMEDDKERVKEFNHFTRNEENLKKLQRIFPIIITTCLSAHKLGDAKPCFDMVILDEAGQCGTATALIPILRGKSLMLVGDPQQLNPVVVLTEQNNLILKNRYQVADEYDYIKNSIYKTFLACDAVSDEILLSYHYRCHKIIIEFNNKKYYNNRLNILSPSGGKHPLIFAEVRDDEPDARNTSPAEAQYALDFALKNRDKKIGVITPFANQKLLIQSLFKQHKLDNIDCGTVHAFQGDEKDVILFSLALTGRTMPPTYNWLKGNKELINVATSRAKDQLILIANSAQLERLHSGAEDDDLYELAQYVKTNGESDVTQKTAKSRALGIKPYSTETENAFLQNINHAIENIQPEQVRYEVKREVAISHVFKPNLAGLDLFYSGRFDFVVYERQGHGKEMPMFAIELDGKEHFDDETVKARDRKKMEICRAHGFELIRIENSYARRYQYIKDILIAYFERV